MNIASTTNIAFTMSFFKYCFHHENVFKYCFHHEFLGNFIWTANKSLAKWETKVI